MKNLQTKRWDRSLGTSKREQGVMTIRQKDVLRLQKINAELSAKGMTLVKHNEDEGK